MTNEENLPTGFETKGVTGRDGYIIAEALVFAMKYIDNLPSQARPEVDKKDIIRILNAAFPTWEDVFGPAG